MFWLAAVSVASGAAVVAVKLLTPSVRAMDPLEAHLRRQIEHSRDFFWHRVRWRAVAEQLGQPPFVLTDVGAGIGLVGDYLRAGYPGATYRFVEPIESLVRDLESRFGAGANDNDAADYKGSRYVTLLDVLEHIADDRRFIEDLLDKMESGALLIVTVPALTSLWSEWDVALGHYRRYDRRTLERVFSGLPVRVRELSYLFPEMLPLAMVRRRRRPASRAPGSVEPPGAPAASSAEFPDVPAALNAVLYGVGRVSLALRRHWGAGTSMLAVVERT